jgi:hypothetical protein
MKYKFQLNRAELLVAVSLGVSLNFNSITESLHLERAHLLLLALAGSFFAMWTGLSP